MMENMMENMIKIDARNQECPVPVLLTRQVVEEQKPESVQVIVDNDASRQNVSRYLKSMAYLVSDHPVDDEFHVTGVRGPGEANPSEIPEPVCYPGTETRKIMVVVATDRIGYGDDSLGLKLMANFIRTLEELGPDLWRLVFLNNGVKLAIESSVVIDALQKFEKGGVKIMVCGTCLEHYRISELKRAGETTNMLDIVTAMQLADKVISV